MAYIHAIYFANLSGNTFDALLARLKGYRVEGSHLWVELLCAPLTAPILLFIRWKARHDKRFARLLADD